MSSKGRHPCMQGLDRRRWMKNAAFGIGWLSLVSKLSMAQGEAGIHFPAKAKRVIFLFMDGGPSQVDTWDPKPQLSKLDGQPFPLSIDATQFDQNGRCLGSPFAFSKHGESGLEISELFPNLSKHADRLCVIRSMKSEFAEHSQACMFLHTGFAAQGRPSMGAWLGYGLGSENQQLPSYVVLNGGLLPIGGPENFSNAFLPAVHAGTIFDTFSGSDPVRNIQSARDPKQQAALLHFLNDQDRGFLASQVPGSQHRQILDSSLRNDQTAMAMQSAVPQILSFADETKETLSKYGVDSNDPLMSQYAKECLLARRLIESGVRFVEVTCVKGIRFIAPWDDHDNLEAGHRKNARVVDQPIAALIDDLQNRGLLDSTLIICAGEFGRTPFAQGGKGRDHNPQGFSIWMAGGGTRGGYCHGSTDEFGYRATEDIVSVYDLQATVLRLMGIDHERLTFRWGGRDYRLTDVHGNVVQACLA